MATFEELKNKDPDTEAYLAKVAKAESGNNPNAKNPYGSATGLFQFTSDTWKGLTKKYNLNYTLEDRKNPNKAANVMRLFTKENENQIQPLVGRDLNDGDRYLAHFLGAQGAKKFFTAYNSNPNLPISVVMSPAALNANKQVVYDKQGKLKTVSDVYGWAAGKMNAKVSPKIYNEESIEPTKSFNTYINPTPGELETSETEFVEDTQEVSQAKQDLTEKSFIEDFKNRIESQQHQIQELQKSLRPIEQPVQQQEEQFVLDEMPDPYNYIQLDSGMEEFQRGGITVSDKNNPRYKAYQDSLVAYRLGNEVYSVAKSQEGKQGQEALKKVTDAHYDFLDKYPNADISGLKPIKKIPYSARAIDHPQGAMPLTLNSNKNKFGDIPIYKKPNQIINYQSVPPQIRNEKSITSINPVGIQSNNIEIEGQEIQLRPQARQTYGVDRFQNKYLAKGQAPVDYQEYQQRMKNNPNALQDVNMVFLKDPSTLNIDRKNDARYARWNESYNNLVEGEDFIYIDSPKLQEGGTIKDNIPNFLPDVVTTPSEKQFLIDYINSPNYKEKLINSGYKDVDAEIQQRLKNVQQTNEIKQFGKPGIVRQIYNTAREIPYSTNGSAYDEKTHTLISDPITDREQTIYAKPNEIKSHEYAHAETSLRGANVNGNNPFFVSSRLNNYDEKQLFERQINSDPSSPNYDKPISEESFHDMQPIENKADLNALRYLLKERGIYDSGKGEFKKEHLKKLPKSFVKDRLLKNYKEEDLIWLMNNIAMNDEKSNIQYAEQGAIIEDDRGQWAHPGEITKINSGNITMSGVDYPVFGVDNLGNSKMMYPNQDYKFPGSSVIEYPQTKRRITKRFSK